MSEIKVLSETDYDELVRLQVNAYPGFFGFGSVDKERLREAMKKRNEDRRVTFYGSYQDGEMVACWRQHDYQMNLRGTVVPCGGIGGIAVDLHFKRERLAGELMLFYLNHYRERGCPTGVLWPFRPDFYRKMGFGYGGKKQRYVVSPESLPSSTGKKHIFRAIEGDLPELLACYKRLHATRNGLLDETEQSLRTMLFGKSAPHVAVYREGSSITGFLLYRFKSGGTQSALLNDIHVEECLFESPQALPEFCAFLHSQRDQARHVILDIADDNLHHLLGDPRDDSGRVMPPVFHQTNRDGVGVMYRALGIPAVFEALSDANFGAESICVCFTVTDSFWELTDTSVTVQFESGAPRVDPEIEPDVDLVLSSADFSSMLVGSIPPSKLIDYGLARISNTEAVVALDHLFVVTEPPFCLTRF